MEIRENTIVVLLRKNRLGVKAENQLDEIGIAVKMLDGGRVNVHTAGTKRELKCLPREDLIPIAQALPDEIKWKPEDIIFRHLPEILISLARFAYNTQRDLENHEDHHH